METVRQGKAAMLKTGEIRVRDPFVVLHGDTYYLYATTGETVCSCYKSRDLENWEEGGVVFEIPKDFWAYKDVWAGEVHRYNGKFYLFVSLLGKNGLRGTQVAVADQPEGPFVPLTDRAVTPAGQSCIDGTLYVENGVPYVVDSHDWPDHYVPEKDAYVGEICAARLTPDLKAIDGEPKVLFDSDEAPISEKTPHHIEHNGKICVRYGSDGPFLRRFEDGRLVLIWSPYLENNYVVLGAVSESGSVAGPWRHMERPVFDRNGGHAMLFTDRDGVLMMALHAPERFGDERAEFYPVAFKEGQLRLVP